MVLECKEVEVADEGMVTPRQEVIDYQASWERVNKSECRGNAMKEWDEGGEGVGDKTRVAKRAKVSWHDFVAVETKSQSTGAVKKTAKGWESEKVEAGKEKCVCWLNKVEEWCREGKVTTKSWQTE